MQYRRFLKPLGAAALWALSACSSGSMTPPATAPAIPDSMPFRAAADTSVNAVIHWKFASDARSVRIDVSVKGPRSTILSTKIVNKPLHGAVTDVRLDAPAGDDDFAFTVFDQPSGGGNQLGGTTVSQTIHANEQNTIEATFKGYAAGFRIHPIDSRMKVVYATSNGPSPTIYDIAGQGAVEFSVAVTDADGRVILAPYAPKVTALSEIKSVFTVAPVKGHANTFTIQAIGPMPTVMPHLILEAPGTQGTTDAQSYPLTETPLLYASAGSGSKAHIYAFDTLGNSYPFSGTFSGLQRPIGLALDQSHARIYVADAGAAKVFAYDENGNAIAGWNSPSVPGITGIAFSPHTGYVYASSNAGSGAIAVFNAKGAPVSLPGGFASLHAPPVGVAYDPSYQLIAVAESGSPGYLDVYSDGGTYFANQSSALSDLNGLPFTPAGVSPALDGAGDFWIAGEDGTGSGSTPTPTVAIYMAETGFFNGAIRFLDAPGILNWGFANSVFEGIGAPLSVAASPANSSIFYVVQAAAPMWGLYCGADTICIAAQTNPWLIDPAPASYPAIPVPGYVGSIGYPGVTNFTAAVFTQH